MQLPYVREKRKWLHLTFSTCLLVLLLGSAAVTTADDQIQMDVEKLLEIDSDADYGAYLAGECLACHSPDAASQTIPKIHGKDRTLLATALLQYQAKKRSNVVMQGIAANLSSEDIAALVMHFSSQP